VITPEPFRAQTAAGLDAPRGNASKVARVAEQLRRRESTAPLSRRKRAVSHRVPKVHDKKNLDEKIDLLDFDEVIEIDLQRRICIAEARRTFLRARRPDAPFRARADHRAGAEDDHPRGAVAGCFDRVDVLRPCGFHDTCLEYEIITAKGEC